MNRRNFLALAGAALAGLHTRETASQSSQNPSGPKWRTFEVTTRIEVLNPVGTKRVWVPMPLSEATQFQRTIAFSHSSESPNAKVSEYTTGRLRAVVAEFPPGATPVLKTVAQVSTRDWSVDLSVPKTGVSPAHEGSADFLRPTDYVPTQGIIRQKALEITKGAQSDLDQARAIYEWVIENTYRSPKVRGCGKGDVKAMLETGDLGGKCADLNGLYVGLARAAGIPARDVYGIRLAKSQWGYKSLGASSETVTKAQHCRAEVFLSQFGWTPVDAADVRKVALEEPPGNLPIDSPMVKQARAQLFGSWEMNWMAYNYAQDVALPKSSGPPLNFFMYPVAETDDGRRDSLDPDSFKYEITSRELT